MVSVGKYEGVTSTAFEQSNVWGCALCVRKFNNAKAILEDIMEHLCIDARACFRTGAQERVLRWVDLRHPAHPDAGVRVSG